MARDKCLSPLAGCGHAGFASAVGNEYITFRSDTIRPCRLCPGNVCLDVERGVSNFRSMSNNWQDYIPLLRIFPKMNNEAEEFRIRRDKYLTFLLYMLKDRISKGTDKPCITGNILKDPKSKLNDRKIPSPPEDRKTNETAS